MGKSPAKWIKTILFGKKSSKSNLSKNATNDKKVSAKASVNDVVSESRRFTDRGADTLEHEKGTSETLCDTNALSPVNKGEESPINFVAVSISDAEMGRQVQAATKAQAAFRGYLARRAFRDLKGIIRLQALIRGHLVRRQAVATLHSMHAIVRLQALARGRRVRLLNTMPKLCQKYNLVKLPDAKREDVGANTFLGSEKLARKAFARKLLLSLPTAMPLSLQYDTSESNSVSNWLDRWSLSQFWIPPPQPKKILNVKPKKKPIGSQILENEAGKSKRSIRKASNAANGDNGVLASFETDKPKNNPRKAASHQIEQEQPQNELERVKRSLRKVSASEKAEMEAEKPQQHLSLKKESNSAVLDEITKETTVSVLISDKQTSLEIPPETATINESVDMPKDDAPLVEPQFLENDDKVENTPFVQEESGKENQKIRKRRSFPSKQEYVAKISQNTPSLPSYMAATESAKAKLRAQGSTELSDDGAEGGSARRYSLPASMNGKLSSLSPRIQKALPANGKGGSKSNKSLASSRDDKVGWRR